jgi:hypothetical protein
MGNQSRAKRQPDGRLQTVWEWHRLIGDDEHVSLFFAEVDGRAVCARLELGASFERVDQADPKPLTTAALRAVPLSGLIEEAATKYAETLRTAIRLKWATAPHAKERLLTAERGLEKPKRPGRPRLYGEGAEATLGGDPDRYEKVAGIYNTEAKAGNRAPNKAVAQAFDVSKSCAAKWVSHSRKLGLIPPYNAKGGNKRERNRKNSRRSSG